MDAEKKLELLRGQVEGAASGEPEDFEGWRQRTASALRLAMGQGHQLCVNFEDINYGLVMYSLDTPPSAWDDAQEDGVRQGTAILEAAIFEVEATISSMPAQPGGRSTDGPVFIVHGHNTQRVAEVSNTVNALTGKKPVVLHEEADEGRTIIEKFEHHAAGASFVVAILTADDVGRAESEGPEKARARQNVVFEAGYFIGALGRSRVVLLHEAGVDLPSDLDGVLYKTLDDGGAWRYAIATEMQAAGLDADKNKL